MFFEVNILDCSLGIDEKVDTWATRPTSAEQRPYGTGVGAGAVFDAGGEWLAKERRRKEGKGGPRERDPW